MAKKPRTPKQFTATIKKLRKEIGELEKARKVAGKQKPKKKKPAKRRKPTKKKKRR